MFSDERQNLLLLLYIKASAILVNLTGLFFPLMTLFCSCLLLRNQTFVKYEGQGKQREQIFINNNFETRKVKVYNCSLNNILTFISANKRLFSFPFIG